MPWWVMGVVLIIALYTVLAVAFVTNSLWLAVIGIVGIAALFLASS